MRVIVTGGGTGGHIYPALSMINEIKSRYPGAVFLYIGTPDGLESKIVPEAGVDFKTLRVSGIRRSLSVQNFKTAYHLLTSINKAKKLIRQFKPDIVIGTGGYVAGPVMYAAAKLKVKTIVHEQNSLPGITNKILSRYVDRVLICFHDAKKYFAKPDRVILTGNPRATEVANTLKLGKLAMGLNPKKKTVLISGGSRGARPINDAFIAMINEYEAADFEVVFVTGAIHYDKIIAEIESFDELKNVKILPFIADMPKFLVNIDLFVGRSGATFLSEITSLGVASILIPSPYVAENHQEFNARSITDHGGGVLILERDLSAQKLYNEIKRILADEQLVKNMQSETKKLGLPDASDRIIKVIEDLL